MNKEFYFYNSQISQYGVENGYVDLEAFASNFSHIPLCDKMFNNVEYELINGSNVFYCDSAGKEYTFEEREDKVSDISSEIDELIDQKSMYEDKLENGNSKISDEELENLINELDDKIADLNNDISSLEYEMENPPLSFYHIDKKGVDLLSHYTNEQIYYIPEYDMYIWGVTHIGTSWTCVLTNIKIDPTWTKAA